MRSKTDSARSSWLKATLVSWRQPSNTVEIPKLSTTASCSTCNNRRLTSCLRCHECIHNYLSFLSWAFFFTFLFVCFHRHPLQLFVCFAPSSKIIVTRARCSGQNELQQMQQFCLHLELALVQTSYSTVQRACGLLCQADRQPALQRHL